MRWTNTQRTSQYARPGFTLIELLVVISIIAILMTLSVAAVLKVMGTQPKAITTTLIQRLDSRLAQQTAFARDKLKQQGITQTAQLWAGAGGKDTAMVIHFKLGFRQWFPQSFAEALTSPAPGYPVTSYQAYLANYGITTNTLTTPPQPYESAACLLMFLHRGPETAGDDDAGLTANTQSINGIPCLVDGWRQPLVFCRWPTGDLQQGGAGGSGISPVNISGIQQGFNDPLDPKGMLTAQSWLLSSYRTTFEQACHPVPNRAQGNPYSLNLAPVIASSGPDKQLGLSPTSLQITNQSQANDNVYNH